MAEAPAVTARRPAAAAVIASEDEAVAVARALADRIAPTAAERDRAGAVPREALALLDRSGLIGITVPPRYGGAGVRPAVLAEVLRLIAAADPAIAQIPQGHFLVVDVLRVHGSERQRRRWFADILDGGRFASALAERGAHHAQDLRTTVGERDGRVLLSGRKYYCTGALTARALAVSARDRDGRLTLALVPATAPGITLDEDWSTMGQRATVSGGATLDDVIVDRDDLIDYAAAFEAPQQLGARAQLVHTAIEVGIAGGALRDARDFVRTRARPFFEAVLGGWGDTAGEDPHATLRFGRLATRVRAAEQLLRWAAEELEQVGLVPADAEAAARGSLAVAQAKAFGSEVAVEVSSELFALAGASATDERYALSRHWRNSRTHSVHDPVDWKYHHLGAYLLNDVLPPNHGQL
ncbi:MAG: SfnB family sulfur acquisition oxidoreductase [Thermoleophilia bacterium]